SGFDRGQADADLHRLDRADVRLEHDRLARRLSSVRTNDLGSRFRGLTSNDSRGRFAGRPADPRPAARGGSRSRACGGGSAAPSYWATGGIFPAELGSQSHLPPTSTTATSLRSLAHVMH